jgi:microcystin-dependent protein
MPVHTHIQNAHAHNVTRFDAFYWRGNGNQFVFQNTGTVATSQTTATNQNTGGGQAHNNMPPYITSFKWERTA